MEHIRNYKKLHEEHDNILVVNFCQKLWKESAIYAGLHYASGSYISIIDADLQQDPEIVRNMVNILEGKTGYRCGSGLSGTAS